jgi:hypothetical protein
VLEWSERWGRYPATGALFAFVALELAHPRPDFPRTLGIAIALYSYWALAGMAVYGREQWARSGEGFAVAFGLLARIAPFAVWDRRAVIRWPFAGLGGPDRVPGALLFVAVLLGSTSFDGFSRSTTWQKLQSNVRADLADSSGRMVDLVMTFVSVAGLAAFVGAVVVTYVAAVWVARTLVHSERSLVPDFVLSLVPIAAAYLAAHYFSLFVINGQFIVPLVSDPFGRDWDLFGTADFAPNLAVVSPRTVWYFQVSALVVGHVAGLAIAHDRAVALFDDRRTALRSQYPMLALMVLYTVGGLWLLSQR